ncbi:hypothetical protein [Dethiothermospora halolimnae]|uniref:hypothetical protein n=1 Tax=Dethiothermospora halolimnae TaxID=3114390 RepID=UPI003CCBA042
MFKEDFSKSIEYLNKNACDAILLRLNRDILETSQDFSTYKENIIKDKKVQTALSWQKKDGYFGDYFHGGWIPENKKIKSSKAMEAALILLHEMGFEAKDDFISKALKSLLKKDFNKSWTSWDIYSPEQGLYGDDYERALLFAYFGIEDKDFIKKEIDRAINSMKILAGLNDLKEAYYVKNNQTFYVKGKALPDLYQLKLLAYTKKWRSHENLEIIKSAVDKLISFSPLPDIYIMYKGQKIAPAKLSRLDFNKDTNDYDDIDWYQFFSMYELLGRLDLLKCNEVLKNNTEKLINYLEENDGLFLKPVKHKCFKVWGCYSGLMLSNNWSKKNRICDLTYRSLAIIKYLYE